MSVWSAGRVKAEAWNVWFRTVGTYCCHCDKLVTCWHSRRCPTRAANRRVARALQDVLDAGIPLSEVLRPIRTPADPPHPGPGAAS